MDIVERLREFESVKDYWGDWEIAKEAADEIARLREQCDRMASLATDLAIGLDDASKKCGKLENEIERLREQAHYHYENGLKKDVEIERLREALRKIRDGARDVEKSYADLQQKESE